MPVVLWFFAGQMFGQSGDSQIKAGLDLMYNFKMQQAAAVFEKFATGNPKDPRGYYYKSLIFLWEFLGKNESKDFKRFISLADSCIESAENILDSDSKNAQAYNTLGMAQAAKSIALGKNKDYISMAWAGKKSYTALSKSLELDGTLYDNHLGIGLFKFGMSRIPATFSYLLKLIGFEGSINEAVKHLEIAATKGNYTKTEAQYYLSFILSDFLNKPGTAESYLENLKKKYPQNQLFAYTYGICLLKLKQPEKALPVFEDIYKNRNAGFSELTVLSGFLLGDIHFKRNNFVAAWKLYRDFISASKSGEYTGIASWRGMISVSLSGTEAETEAFRKILKKGNSSVEEDTYAARKLEEMKSSGMHREELVLNRFLNYIEAGKYQAAKDSLTLLLSYSSDNEIKCRALLGLCEIATETNAPDEAIRLAKKVNSLEIKYETYTRPFAWYYAAMAYKHKGDKKGFEDAIEKAEDFSGYDFSMKLKSLLQGLKS